VVVAVYCAIVPALCLAIPQVDFPKCVKRTEMLQYENEMHSRPTLILPTRENTPVRITISVTSPGSPNWGRAYFAFSSGQELTRYGNNINETLIYVTPKPNMEIFSEFGAYGKVSVSIEACELLPNLRAIGPTIAEDGSFTYGYVANAGNPMRSIRNVEVSAWYARSDGTLSTKVGWFDAGKCNNQLPLCYDYAKVHSFRPPMKPDEDRIVIVADTYDTLPERFEAEDDNRHSSTFLDDFAMEKIPGLMKTLPPTVYKSGWDLASYYLGQEWEYRARRAAAGTVGLDWQVLRTGILSMDWLLNPNNARRNRFGTAFLQLIAPSYFLPEGSGGPRKVIRDRIKARLIAQPNLTSFRLTPPNLTGEDYHRMHVTYNKLDESYFYDHSGSLDRPDGLDGALGLFSIYLVPFGQVTRENRRIKVEIRAVQVHAVDMFDFRGDQFLGCWGSGFVSLNFLQAAVCVANSSYREFAKIKNRGGDFLNMSDVKRIELNPPLLMNYAFE
jgi:hypothetical protein